MKILAIAPIALYGVLSVSAQDTPKAGKNVHPCEKDLDTFKDTAKCLKAMYKEFDQVMNGKFSKPMKKGIKKLTEKMKDESPTSSTSSGSSPSPVTESSAPSSSTGSSFEPVTCTYAEGCAEGFCKVDYNHEGTCYMCPAAGEMCDPTLTTHTDFFNCCNSCPDAVCDHDAWKNNWTSYRDTLDVVPDVALVTRSLYHIKPEAIDFWTNFNDLVRRDTAGKKGCLGVKSYGIHNATQNYQYVIYWESLEAINEYVAWRVATLSTTAPFIVEGTEDIANFYHPVYLTSIIETNPVPKAGVLKAMSIQPEQVEDFLGWFTTNIVGSVMELPGFITADIVIMLSETGPTNVIHFATEWKEDYHAENFNVFFEDATVAAWLEDSTEVTDTMLFVPEIFRSELNRPYWGYNNYRHQLTGQ